MQILLTLILHGEIYLDFFLEPTLVASLQICYMKPYMTWGKAESYLIFLKDHHYDYMLPDGEDFCDPSLKMP